MPPVEEISQPQNEENASKSPQIKPTTTEESNVAKPEEEKPTPTAETEVSKEQEKEEEASRDCDSPRAESTHDESDYEDNITVTVPKPQTHTNNYHDYRDRQHMNGRYNRSTNINEMESASNQTQSHQVSKYFSKSKMFSYPTSMVRYVV